MNFRFPNLGLSAALFVAGSLFTTSLSASAVTSVKTFGATGNGQVLSDGTISAGSNVLATASSHFVASDANKLVIVLGAEANGANLITVITRVQDATHVLLAQGVGKTASNVTAYWATDDSAAIARALKSAISAGGTLQFPSGMYLNQTRLLLESPLNIQGAGQSSILIGDPGNMALVQVTATSNVNISAMKIANVHTNVGTESSYTGLQFSNMSNGSVSNSWFVGGRPAVGISASSSVTVSGNQFQSAKDYAISVGARSSNVTIQNNTVTGSLTTGINGPPHDINLEDTDNSLVQANNITDGTGFTESGASCMQLYPNHDVVVQNVVFKNNVCTKTGGYNFTGFLGAGPNGYTNIQLVGNTFANYNTGILISGLPANAMYSVLIQNNILKGNLYGMNILGRGLTENSEGLEIDSNTVTGPGALPGSKNGILLQLLQNVSVTNNNVSENGSQGILLLGVSRSIVTNNTVFNNGQLAPSAGIGVATWTAGLYSNSNTISQNSIFDDQTKPTQSIPVQVTAGQTLNVVGSNILTGP